MAASRSRSLLEAHSALGASRAGPRPSSLLLKSSSSSGCKSSTKSAYSTLTSDEAPAPAPPRLRFAPSPTGFLHLGGLRTALFNHLFARRGNGSWILRIEDTDQNRFVPGAVEALQDTLAWAKLDYDEGPDKPGPNGPYVQSERLELYKRYAEKLIESGHAYRDFRPQEARKPNGPRIRSFYMPPDEDEARRLIREGRTYVVRLKTEQRPTTHTDLVYGQMHFPADAEGDDPILLKSDGWPTYHLASVVDDHEMGITHVMRGEEWLPSLPKHLALYSALSLRPPSFAHLPLLMNPDGSKLSKRSGDVRVEDYRQKGYEPEAMLNFVALMGYNHHNAHPARSEAKDPPPPDAPASHTGAASEKGAGQDDDREVLSLQELIRDFDLSHISHSRATMSLPKLAFLNRHHLQRKVLEPTGQGRKELVDRVRPLLENNYPNAAQLMTDEYIGQVISVIKERAETLTGVPEHAQFFFQHPDWRSSEAEKMRKSVDTETIESVVQATIEQLSTLSPSVSSSSISATLSSISTSHETQGLKGEGKEKGKARAQSIMKPLRWALTGRKAGPTVADTLATLGPARSIERLEAALEFLSKSARPIES